MDPQYRRVGQIGPDDEGKQDSGIQSQDGQGPQGPPDPGTADL